MIVDIDASRGLMATGRVPQSMVVKRARTKPSLAIQWASGHVVIIESRTGVHDPSHVQVRCFHLCGDRHPGGVGVRRLVFEGGASGIPLSYSGLRALALFLAAKRHVRLQFTSLTYDGHSLKYQDGFFAKSTRMLNLTKIQDVRVDQGIMDRMLGIGTVTFETAGESSRLVMENVDRPQDVAHRIPFAFGSNLQGAYE